MHCPDGLQQLGARRALADVGPGARFQRREDLLLEGITREHDGAHVRPAHAQLRQELDAADPGQPQVQHRDVRRLGHVQRERLLRARGFADDLHVRLCREDREDALANHGVIVDDQEADRLHGQLAA
jgi:hypothetical protein